MGDRLERALGALRESETGSNPRSEATLDRVLASRRGTTASWGKRGRLLLPIAAVLVVGTTALARSGAIQRIRAYVATETERGTKTEVTERSAAPASPAMPPAAEEPSLPPEVPSASAPSPV